MSDTMIQCSGSLEAAQGAKGIYFMRANTGQPMRLWNYDRPVVIDMSGAVFAKTPTPILYYHDEWLPLGVTTEQKVSATTEPMEIGSRTVNEPGIFALWKITSSADFAKEVQGNIEGGFPFEVSIGANPLEMNRVGEGETVTVNGVQMKGPLAVAVRSEIKEISVCVFGACPGTGNFKASKTRKRQPGETQASDMEGKEGTMEALESTPTPALEANQAGAGVIQTPASSAPTEADIKAKKEQEAENERRKAIELIAKYAKVEAGVRIQIGEAEFKTINAAKNFAIRDGISADDFDKACQVATVSRSVGPVIHSKANGCRSNILQASALLSFGVPGEWLEKNGYTAAEVEAADREQNRVGFIPMMGEALQAAERPVDYLNPHQVVRDFHALQASGVSTTNFGSINIFSPILDKKMKYQYDQIDSIWRKLYSKRTVKDFKEVATVDWTVSGEGKDLIEDEDYPTVTISSSGEKFGTKKQGIRAAITWEQQVNDDMGELGQLGAKLVQIVYDSQCDGFWTDFWSSFSTKYNTSPAKNKTTKTLTTAGLSAAKKLFRALKNTNGRFINVTPTILLVPPALEDVAQELMKWPWAGENNTKGNIHQGKYTVWSDPYLGADGGFTSQGASDTCWFMLADPGRYPLGEYAVLNGYGTPRVVETWFDHKDNLNIRVKGTVGFHGYTSKLPAVFSDGTTS